jgi:hypothetical protein
MFMIDYKQVNWWYWFATACVLAAGFAGYQIGFVLAIALSVVQFVHFLVRERNLAAFTVQVRSVVLLYMVAAFFDPTKILFGIAVAGTWARSIFGYCLMARTVSLFPWNLRTVHARCAATSCRACPLRHQQRIECSNHGHPNTVVCASMEIRQWTIKHCTNDSAVTTQLRQW